MSLDPGMKARTWRVRVSQFSSHPTPPQSFDPLWYCNFMNAVLLLTPCLKSPHCQAFKVENNLEHLYDWAIASFKWDICNYAMFHSKSKETSNACGEGVKHHWKTTEGTPQFHGINDSASNELALEVLHLLCLFELQKARKNKSCRILLPRNLWLVVRVYLLFSSFNLFRMQGEK